MKLRIYLLSLALFSCVGLIMAQDNPQKKNTQDIEGEVKVYQDEAIKNLIGTPRTDTSSQNDNHINSENNTSTSITPSMDNRRGSYRILVYSGSTKESKNEAFSRRNLIKERFAEMSVDVNYNSPLWRVRAGFFTTRTEAEAALHQLKNAFPGIGAEMYIIRVAPQK